MMTATSYESYYAPGAPVTIRCSNGQVKVSENAGELLHFLRYSSAQTLRVAWNLDDFIAPVLRLLPPEILDRLASFDETLVYQGHELYYAPERLFRVGKSRYYSIQDFWGGSPPTPANLEEVQRLATELLGTMEAIGLGDLRKLTSPIAVFEDSAQGRAVYDSIPKGVDIPRPYQDALTLAAAADQKDWVSNYAVGHFEAGTAHNYDISAAYASLAAHLPDLRDLQFWRSKTFGSREQAALIGVVRGRFTLDPNADYAHSSPIIRKDPERIDKDEGELPTNPLGKLPEDGYTLTEVRWVLDNGVGTFRMKEGIFASTFGGGRVRYPFKPIMETLYKQREISPLAATVTKAIGNSLVGKLIETRITGEYGPLRNDLYHALITAACRVQIARFLVAHEVTPSELIAVQTDGVRLTRKIELSRGPMGTWRYSDSDALVALSPYRIFTGTKRPYSLTYSDVTSLIAEHPASERYSKPHKRRVTLKMAKQLGDIHRVGEIIDSPASFELINLSGQQNRLYRKLPKTGRTLLSGIYPSTPIIL